MSMTPSPSTNSEAISPLLQYVISNLVVNFQGTTDAVAGFANNVVSWLWDFGDGATSTLQNPSHTYSAAGTYTATVTAYAPDGAGYQASGPVAVSASASASGSYPIAPANSPLPGFSYVMTDLSAAFTDTSTTNDPPLSSWSWDFGDGSSVSTLQNPSHTYAAAGTYTVAMTVLGYGGTDSPATITQQIVASVPPVVAAAFNYTEQTLVITFTDVSTTSASGATIDLWHWDFGDGTTSTAQNPQHTYSAAGTYTVALTAGDSASNTNQVSQSVVVVSPSFSYVVSGLTSTFTDTSTTNNPPISTWLWNFGDGQTSQAQNPVHTYASAGTYSVSLTITDYLGAQSPVTRAVTVTAPTPTPSPTPTPTPTPTPSPTPSEPSYVLKGFVEVSALAVSTPNTPVGQLGELSTYGRTFSKEIIESGTSTGGGTPSALTLNVFSSIKADGTAISVPTDYSATILAISSWIYNQAVAGSFTADPAVFVAAIQAQYGSTINTVTVDQMLTQAGIWMPGMVQFYFTNASTIDPTDTTYSRIKLWFSDQAFRAQYDLFSITVVPPISNLDNFFLTASQIQTQINNVTVPQLLASVQTARANEPETILDSMIFNWIDPVTVGNFIPTNWTYLIWGPAGNNIDSIKAALQSYILANSTHTRAQWAQIFPDIFTNTEFVLMPVWTQYAIPNQTLNPGMYQPTLNPNQALTMALNVCVGGDYTEQAVANTINFVPTAYKTLVMAAVGNPQNDGGIVEFQVRFPDFLDIPTTSTDFSRMSQSTQGFVQLLNKLLAAAETMTNDSDLPTDITRLVRTNTTTNDQVMYAVANYENVDYLVVTKAYLTGKFGEATNTTATIGISYAGTFNNGAYQLLSSSSTMSLQLTANNAVVPNTWTLLDTTATSASINTQTGLLTATFPSVGAYTFTVMLTDHDAHSTTQTLTFNYQTPQTGGSNTLTFGAQSLPEGTVNTAFAGTIDITGGTAPYVITNQTMPPGISAVINGTVINISGTPTTASGTTSGTTCVIGIVDSTSGTPQAASLQFVIHIAAQGSQTVTVGTPSNTQVFPGTQYSGQLAITGGVAPYTVVSDTLPAGLSAAVVTNYVAISGTPTTQAAGNVACEVVVQDAVGNQGTSTFVMNVGSVA